MSADPFRNITLVDTETTGLNPDTDEVVGIGLLCLRVDGRTGDIGALVGDTVQWREPSRIGPDAEAVLRITRAQLQGCRLDRAELDWILAKTDLVVAHNAAFDRPFVEKLCPRFSRLLWACSMTEIDWRIDGLPGGARLGLLLRHHGIAASAGGPDADCRALVELLTRRAGDCGPNGFQLLMKAWRDGAGSKL